MRHNEQPGQPMDSPSQEWTPGPAWRAAEAAGFDMSLIEISLAKTPWERVLNHEDALTFATMLREAGSIELTSPGGKWLVLDIPALIKAKEAMGRPHDKLTVIQLKAIQERQAGKKPMGAGTKK